MWARLAYLAFLTQEQRESQAEPPSLVQLAMEQCQTDMLDHCLEKATGAQAVFGWNSQTLIVAFRGSCSMSNWVSDLQVGLCCCSAFPQAARYQYDPSADKMPHALADSSRICADESISANLDFLHAFFVALNWHSLRHNSVCCNSKSLCAVC